MCKSGVWYLVADVAGEPRLFRVSRVEAVRDDLLAVAAEVTACYAAAR